MVGKPRRFAIYGVIASCFLPALAPGQPVANEKARGNPDAATRLARIVDRDLQGRTIQIRSNFIFDAAGRRVANDVTNAAGKRIATERFSYDEKGRLMRRRYRVEGGGMKWMWREFDYQADGEPARNHIVNKLEKSIGHYEWKYHNGRLLRRDRFNADGTLRFYYAAMKYDPQGHPLEWSKFDRNGRKIGVKSWLYEN